MDRRRFLGLGFALAGTWCALPAGWALAFSTGKHNKIIESALFGREDYSSSVRDTPAGRALKALEAAVYLCLDQYNNYGAEELDTLDEYGVKGLPNSIDEIAFTGNDTHRRYTHLGWNYTYMGAQDKGQNWPVRKAILVNTVKRVFGMDGIWSNISSLWDTSGEEWCDAFAAMLYYLHVLGDQIDRLTKNKEDGKVGEDENAMKFVQVHPDLESNPDIATELELALKKVLVECKGDRMYEGLFDGLDVYARQAREIVGRTGGINTIDRSKDLLEKEENYLEVLKGRLPGLLKKVSHMKEVFG